MADRPPANRLAQETSPYLQQHAHNPVDWYPWGDEALQRARDEDRPILLSVGYSACHWCHVMERESFENADIAAVMNELFVNIKVDREERPDIDEIYMTAVQAMTGQGGWPMTVFLTPDLRPFYGGTYYPPEDRYGRPGFPRVLHSVSQHYREQRDRVEQQADKLRDFLAQNADPLTRGGEGLDGARGHDILQKAAHDLVSRHDERFGGFSHEGPKFPNAAGLSLLLRHWHVTGDDSALEVALHTLGCMARGGLYDHLGGGFHRYSVDERWLVPHFEKMLYDNALLVPVYVDAWQASREPRFARVVRETLDYVVREMTAPEGGYAATQDADSEGEEGKFFVWTPEQVEEVLDDDDLARCFCEVYDVTPHGNFEGHSILHLEAEPDDGTARRLSVTSGALQESLDEARRRLFEARSWRVAPGRDDKVVAAWNGLMVSAMARGYQAFGASTWLASARQAAEFLLSNMVVDGVLMHSWKDGQAQVRGFQDDYAAVVAGLVDLYEATLEPRWLASARQLAERMVELFFDAEAGGFYYAEADRADLIVRTKNPFDGATPAGNSMAVLGLLRLSALTEDESLRHAAVATLTAYAGLLENAPAACCLMVCALSHYRRGPLELTVVGSPEGRRPFLQAAHARYLPDRVIAGAEAADDETTRLLPLLRERHPGDDGRPRAWVCRDATCSAPLDQVSAFEGLLAESERVAS